MRPFFIGALIATFGGLGQAAAQTIDLNGNVDAGAPDHVRIPFEVPAGIVEIEVAHDDLSDENILDWGLEDPNGFRGWGGGNDEPAVVGIEAASRSYLPGPIPPGTWNVLIGKAKIAEPPGQYAITVTLRDAPTLAPQPERQPFIAPAAIVDETRWYAGDFHVHSRESGDARATLDEIGNLAAMRGLDFVVITDHNTVSHADYLNEAQSRHPSVLFIPGIEVTTYAGHGGALGATQFVEHKIGLDGATIEAAVQSVHDQGALFSINHPAFDIGDLCIGCAWDHELSADLVHAMEIGTAAAAGPFLPQTLARWESTLDAGAHAAALGGSDDHRAGIDLGALQTPIGSPTTMVYADGLSIASILAGVRAGRTVVKLEGPDNPMVELTTDPPLSADTTTGANVRIVTRVTGGVGRSLRLVSSGEELTSVDIDADPFSFVYELSPTTETRVRAEVVDGSTTQTITSHVWIQSAPANASAASGGCGCIVAGQASTSRWWLAFALIFLRRCRTSLARQRLGSSGGYIAQ